MSKKVVIIDYQMSNLFSVVRAIEQVGYKPIVSNSPEEILAADALILPGVGAFKAAMDNLDKLGLVNPIKKYITSGKPFMGVCLGLQLLFEVSEEFGHHNGLGIIKGVVKRFETSKGGNEKIPQISWNTIQSETTSWDNTPLKHLKENAFMYFVHSYYVIPKEQQVVLSTTPYCGIEYCSSIKINNIFATQFHPEKSGELGLEIYKNWLIK
jgi:imidazole glycerol-phosphate synthase subunit HisH